MEHFPECLDQPASDGLANQIKALLEARGWGFWAVEVAEN